MTKTPAPKVPKTRVDAIALLDRFKAITGEIETIVANRDTAIAATNAVADTLASPLIDERAAIETALAAWWPKAAADLTGGKRKSAELGGCMIGTKMSRASLEHGFADDDAAVKALREHKWAKPYVRVRYAVDRTETIKALDGGRHAEQLKALGFVRKPGSDDFYVERVGQAGAVTG